MLNGPFPPWPSFTEEEADAVRRVLLSNRVNYWTGDEARQFEREFAAFAGTEHAVAVANGTVALELALRALGLGPGDEVVVPPRTFVASASAVINVGATPVFADIDRDSQNLTAATVEAVLTPRTRAVVAVHLAGWPCDMDALTELARRHDLRVVEDCAQAHGATWNGRPVGGLGDVGCWSFCQDKIMSTGGEGGMITVNDRALWSRIWSAKDHGKSWAEVYERDHPPGFRWLHEGLGTNARLTEMQAVIGRLQLARMADWTRTRRAHCDTLWHAARAMPGLRVPSPPPAVGHAGYKAYVFVEPAALAPGWDRDRVMNEVVARDVPCFSGSCSEVYLEKCFQERGLAPSAPLPVARELGETSLMFLVHPTLDESHLARTVTALAEVMTRATGASDLR
ncbi:DegT/DnrJ/EryC1/StrS aminotransferase family protein [Alcanivorax marinus]|uniref:DegT/DnrJ/EryC1/StrS aminotransferase family protein n=1 Tax=Alloalcanivorax marinus TaxID=1177169 RepID=A0A9Q3UN29_9GAMM|nr:DegT/DnrJ/EryC1/StrS aminotransferase family protein [Alloalcanivorax marinus]MCC4309445.1 DegT/DnrJ/EryC1/StrS aminotransferase family protein [Alloalcanivorax marinus]